MHAGASEGAIGPVHGINKASQRLLSADGTVTELRYRMDEATSRSIPPDDQLKSVVTREGRGLDGASIPMVDLRWTKVLTNNRWCTFKFYYDPGKSWNCVVFSDVQGFPSAFSVFHIDKKRHLS
jgi:hypothetical protein